MKRSFNFEEDQPVDRSAEINKELESIAGKLSSKLNAEKRWLRKLRLSTTKIQKLRASMRRLNKRRDQLELLLQKKGK